MVEKISYSLTVPRVAIRFQSEFLNFEKGIRVGNLEDNQRITRILKLSLETQYRQSFVTERWGRGVYWQWIGYLPRANRSAKPISANVSFGCSKFFLMMDTEERLFKCGFQVERGFRQAPPEFVKCELKSDWDWHRLLKSLYPAGPMARELKRLVFREGFSLMAGTWEDTNAFTKSNLPDMIKIKKILKSADATSWAGFQVYYAMKESEVLRSSGVDLIEAMLAIFREVTPAMNLCMQIQLPKTNN